MSTSSPVIFPTEVKLPPVTVKVSSVNVPAEMVPRVVKSSEPMSIVSSALLPSFLNECGS